MRDHQPRHLGAIDEDDLGVDPLSILLRVGAERGRSDDHIEAETILLERRSRHNGLLNYDARRERITLLVSGEELRHHAVQCSPALAAGETGVLG